MLIDKCVFILSIIHFIELLTCIGCKTGTRTSQTILLVTMSPVLVVIRGNIVSAVNHHVYCVRYMRSHIMLTLNLFSSCMHVHLFLAAFAGIFSSGL